jgi:hypothetical protein
MRRLLECLIVGTFALSFVACDEEESESACDKLEKLSKIEFIEFCEQNLECEICTDQEKGEAAWRVEDTVKEYKCQEYIDNFDNTKFYLNKDWKSQC